ncbi:MAG: hypothetical protein ACKOXL_07600 [Limnohabitans sp.]
MSKSLTPEESAAAMHTVRELWKPTNPAHDGMTRAQLDQHKADLQRVVKLLNEIRPCCGTCTRYDFAKLCSLHGEVPHEFKYEANDCPDWAYQFVPF